MGINSLGTNKSALTITRKLGELGNDLSKTYQRLSSGLRINGASDDPAGNAVATQLASSSRIFSQALRNLNDGISQVQLAAGALNSLRDISMRQVELAEQAANGTLTFNQRLSLHKEANALVAEYNRIIQTTAFNGTTLFDPATLSLNIQAGADGTASSTISTALNSELDRIVGTGNGFALAQTLGLTGSLTFDVKAFDVNNDGKLDIVAGSNGPNITSIFLGNGDGTFLARKNTRRLSSSGRTRDGRRQWRRQTRSSHFK